MFFIISFLSAAVITYLTVSFAVRSGLLLAPNSRSSHVDETPHIGGISFVIVFLTICFYLFIIDVEDIAILKTLIFGGALIAIIGLYDDLWTIRARYRFLLQMLAVIFGYYYLTQEHTVQDIWILPPILVDIIIILMMGWWLNLFNFMDGTDGFAASEAITILISAAVLLEISDESTIRMIDIQQLMWLLTASVIGFLVFNWSPAKTFMGDVGSTFLGYTLSFLALVTVLEGTLSLWVWLILGGVFWVDATITLITRIFTGQKWYLAHHNHAYQKQVRFWIEKRGMTRTQSHRLLSILTIIVNISWLLPLAWVSLYQPDWAILIVIISWAPIAIWVLRMKAGIVSQQ